MNKTHYMKLWNKSFISVKEGEKTIEMRLKDEKRSLIEIGDYIVFENTETNEIIKTIVVNLYEYNNFEELYNNHSMIDIGYKIGDDAKYTDMYEYYKEEDIKKYGVLGIKIKIIN